MSRGPGGDEMHRALGVAAERALAHLDELAERPVAARAGADELRAALGGPLPEGPMPAARVLDELAGAVEPGLVGIPGGRYFGFVIGGAVPAALGADWLTSAWDQNAGLYAAGPSAAVVEEVAGAWLVELLGLAPTTSFGFVTGCQMAHVTGLAAARHHVLAAAGWDVERDGLAGAPRIRVLAGVERHVTVDRALRFLGLGTACLDVVECDDQGRVDTARLARALAGGGGGPTIVCAQAGNVNTGAFDDLGAVADAAHEAGAWVHVDGAFGAWAVACPELRHLVAGMERADSWATDGHKWLNVPYDVGLVFCAHPEAHRVAMATQASYLIHDVAGTVRDPMDWTPEFSRRARGFTVYAALRSLGRTGVADMVARCCGHARRFAQRLGAAPGVEICNDVVSNQVLVRFAHPSGDPAAGDARTRAVVAGVQDGGRCWLSGTTWHGMALMRISVCNWSTTADDVDRSVEAILSVAGMT